MLSFYKVFTCWSFILGILSSVSLILILSKYNTTANISCDVTKYKLNFNLKEYMILALILIIIISFLHVIGYYKTKYELTSPYRKFTIFINFIFYIISVLGSLTLIEVFHTDNTCYNFYKSNNICMLISFVSVNVVYALTISFSIIILLSMCLCPNDNGPNNDFHNIKSSLL